MPYFLRGKCVWKGTEEDPIEEIKCHESRKKALAHMAALYVHVEDADSKKKDNGIFVWSWKDGTRVYDRWIAVSSSATVDLQEEIFTKDAMDYDVAHAERTGKYPELRLWHVRGFKLGQCDHMQRIGKWAVDQGYWFDTPFAQAMKDLVAANDGKWKVSKGFHPVKAAGLCLFCDADLTVGLLNFKFGVRCPQCEEIAKVSELVRLKHLKAVTFDITITDVPVVTNTAVSAYSVQK